MQEILDYWPIIGAAISGALVLLIWLVRLEAKGLANEREIRRLWLQRKEDLASAKEARDATAKMLDEIRRDVKSLLQRGHG